MITAKCVEKVRDKNDIITDYVLEDYNGVRQTLSSAQVKNMLKCGQLSILNLKLTSDGKLIDNQDYKANTADTELPAMAVYKHAILEDTRHNKSWDENYETLCRAINNGVKIVNTTVYEGVNIGIWLNTQRQNFKNGKLSEDKVQKLKGIGLKLEVLVIRSWDENYKTLCKAIDNGVKIASRTVYEGINIGTWLSTQRQLFKNGELSEDKVQKLKELGLELDPRKASWNETYETLCRAINNGVKITQSTVYEGLNIGVWVGHQRQFFKNGKLSEDRIAKLKNIDLKLLEDKIEKPKNIGISWEENYDTLCRAINNGVKITQKTVYEGLNIGIWLTTQRQNFKNGKLSEDRVQKLKEIGLKLEVLVVRSWEENYETLCRAINNGVKVTHRTVYEGANIGIWLTTQRQLFKNGELPEDKIQKIKEIGLELDPRKASWNENYETLCKAIDNGVKITQSTVYEGLNIGTWINKQHQLFKNGKLSEDRIEKLKSIGLELDPKETLSWDESYEILCRAINNGVKVTQKTVYEGINLGFWVTRQRQLFKNGKLSEDRTEKLKSIGLKLDPKETLSWDEKYKTLCRAINNGVKITEATVYEGVNIGIWINTQRQLFRKGKLSEDKIEKLRKIGVIE